MVKAATYPPIGDYALISDCHSGALVSKDGSIDWCVFHRFEARPVFARILDWAKAGFFRIAPLDDDYESTRRYLPGTNVLETTFRTPGGTLVLTDFFAFRPPLLGAHPDHQLIRIARCEEGEVAVKVKLVPRFDYGLTTPRLDTLADDLVVVYGGADGLVLQSELPFGDAERSATEGNRTLQAGEEAFVVLTYELPHELDPQRLTGDQVHAKLKETVAHWTAWADRCTYHGPYREQVLRSALVLKGLTNGPTGSIVAAATTSLPEEVGGVRNWDYRFCWLRDSALTLNALFGLGYTEAHEYMAWLRRTTAGRAHELQIMYGVGGERLLPEVELDWLEGYRGSRPVRIGNGAYSQFQLDVFGELLDTVWVYRRHGGEIDDGFWDFLGRVAGAVIEQWREPDQGIWEIRGEPRHFTYSKVMAWVALDRVVRIAEFDGREGALDEWRAERDELRELIEREGVDGGGAFVQSFGDGGKLDASNLMIPIVGFVDHDDPRARATVERIAAELSADGFVYRYVTDGVDGLSGDEATFAICSFWLVECLARAGEGARARELFERLLGFCNDVGLLAEEIDPASGELLGNFPQAFSHVGLIQAAIALDMPELSMTAIESETRDVTGP